MLGRSWLCLATGMVDWSAWAVPAHAHVEWFLSAAERSKLVHQAKPALFTHLGLVNGGLAILSAVALAVLVLAAPAVARWPVYQRLACHMESLRDWGPTFVGGLTGLMLILNAMDGTFVALDLHIAEVGARWAAIPEGLVGVLLLLGLWTRPAAVALLGLFGLGFALFPAEDAMDLAVVPGIAVYLLALGRGRLALDSLVRGRRGAIDRLGEKLARLAIPALRVCAGVAMITLALHEKLLHPQYAVALIHGRPWINFMAALHLPFGDDLFVLCAGLVQFCLGLCLIAGVFPRLCMAFLAGMFVTTFVAFGVVELYGHLAYVGGLIALSIHGSGGIALPELRRAERPEAAPRFSDPLSEYPERDREVELARD